MSQIQRSVIRNLEVVDQRQEVPAYFYNNNNNNNNNIFSIPEIHQSGYSTFVLLSCAYVSVSSTVRNVAFRLMFSH